MPYQTVALIGKPQHAATHDSLNILAEYLLAKGCSLLVEECIAEELETDNFRSCDLVTIGKEADLAVVVGGYNSSNTTHLVELLEEKFPTYFISGAEEIEDRNNVNGFDIHKKERVSYNTFIPAKEKLKIIITSGASCPDASVDEVIQTIMTLTDAERPIQEVLEEWSAS